METYYTPKQAAEILGKSQNTVLEYLRTGKLEGTKERGRHRISKEQLDNYMQSNQQQVETTHRIKWAGGTYVGELHDNKPHGHGKWTIRTGDKYVGDWKNGNKHGKGKYYSADGTSISGEWINDEYAGSKQQEPNK